MNLFNRVTRRISLALHLPVVHIDLPQRRPRKGAPQLAVIGEGPTPLDGPLVTDLVEHAKRMTGRDDIVATHTASGGVRVGPRFRMTAAEKSAALRSAELLREELEAIVEYRRQHPEARRGVKPSQASIDRIRARLRRQADLGYFDD